MSFLGRREGGSDIQVADVKFIPQGTDAPADASAEQLYYGPEGLVVQDTTGEIFPVVVGADGAGVKSPNHAASPFIIAGSDRLILADPTAGVITIDLLIGYPIGPELVIIDATGQAAVNNITIQPDVTQQINGLGLGVAALVNTAFGRKSLYRVSATQWSMV